MLRTIILVTVALSLPLDAAQEDPHAWISNGEVIGRWQVSREGHQFASFEGIPYAKEPIRFEDPEEPEDWDEAWNATFPRSFCPQFEELTMIYYSDTEDCLFLNVFVPSVKHRSPLPVMFWIHGGGYTYGAGSVMGPRYIMDEDVILITFNYRLGVFGFLNTESNLISGNMAYKDMIMALKWVQKNIHAFGGNHKDVTIFGESAGGGSVHNLLLSPATKGLFHKAIAQSGTALSPWNYNGKQGETFNDLTQRLNCKGTSETELLECLREKPVLEILEYGPTIDPGLGKYSLFPKPMTELAQIQQDVPLIIGFNQNEGVPFAAGFLLIPRDLKRLNENWNQVAPELLKYSNLGLEGAQLDIVSESLRSYYLPPGEIKNNQECIMGLAQLISDLFFIWSTKQSVIAYAETGTPVYPYIFSYRGKFSLVDVINQPTDGPVHADDLQYLFQSLLQPILNWPDLQSGSKDEEFSKKLISLWASFAKHGKPRPNPWGKSWSPVYLRDLTQGLDSPLTWYNLQENSRPITESQDMQSRMRFLNQLLNPPLLQFATTTDTSTPLTTIFLKLLVSVSFLAILVVMINVNCKQKNQNKNSYTPLE